MAEEKKCVCKSCSNHQQCELHQKYQKDCKGKNPISSCYGIVYQDDKKLN